MDIFNIALAHLTSLPRSESILLRYLTTSKWEDAHMDDKKSLRAFQDVLDFLIR
jgi:hypothetical protein